MTPIRIGPLSSWAAALATPSASRARAGVTAPTAASRHRTVRIAVLLDLVTVETPPRAEASRPAGCLWIARRPRQCQCGALVRAGGGRIDLGPVAPLRSKSTAIPATLPTRERRREDT